MKLTTKQQAADQGTHGPILLAAWEAGEINVTVGGKEYEFVRETKPVAMYTGHQLAGVADACPVDGIMHVTIKDLERVRDAVLARRAEMLRAMGDEELVERVAQAIAGLGPLSLGAKRLDDFAKTQRLASAAGRALGRTLDLLVNNRVMAHDDWEECCRLGMRHLPEFLEFSGIRDGKPQPVDDTDEPRGPLKVPSEEEISGGSRRYTPLSAKYFRRGAEFAIDWIKKANGAE